MKIRKIYFLAFSALAFSLGSCDKDSEETIDTIGYTDALVNSFMLSDNAAYAKNLSGYYFTINQYGEKLADNTLTGDNLVGQIFNADSLPVGTKTSKLIAEIGFSNPSKVMLYTASDTVEYDATDSIDFSSPVLMEVIAANGVNKKFYQIKVNVHKQVPDSIHWVLYQNNPLSDAGQIVSQKAVTVGSSIYWMIENAAGVSLYVASTDDLTRWDKRDVKISQVVDLSTLCVFNGSLYLISDGQLIKSTDGTSWSVASQAYQFKNLIGAYDRTEKGSELIGIISDGGNYLFASSSDGTTWKQGESLDLGFPINGYSNILRTPKGDKGSMPRITIMGGVTSKNELVTGGWSYDGSNWFPFQDGDIPALKGASMVKYQSVEKKDSCWMLMGGELATGKYSSDIYLSGDNGVSWNKTDSLITFPANFNARAFMSVYVDANYYINLMGGKAASGELNQIWRGRLNRLAFRPVE